MTTIIIIIHLHDCIACISATYNTVIFDVNNFFGSDFHFTVIYNRENKHILRLEKLQHRMFDLSFLIIDLNN